MQEVIVHFWKRKASHVACGEYLGNVPVNGTYSLPDRAHITCEKCLASEVLANEEIKLHVLYDGSIVKYIQSLLVE